MIVINCINICASENKFISLQQKITYKDKNKEFRRQGSRVGILCFFVC